MKYISFDLKIGDMTRRQVVMFPNDLTHSVMAAGIRAAMAAEFPKAIVLVHAAGFADAIIHGTFGSSETLKMNSDPQDAPLFNTSDYGGHIL